MTALGEFLERFYGPQEFFRTVHARVRHTETPSAESSSSSGQPSIGRRRRDAKPQSKSMEQLTFWAHLPDKVRVETTREKDGQAETTIEIINGQITWKRHADGTVEKGRSLCDGRGELYSLSTEFQRHFDRRLLRQCFAALTLELTGQCRVAGQECMTIHARQIPGAQLWPHWLSFHANEFEFAADVEHAVLLSIKALAGQETVETHEVLDVTFDLDIDESSFVYEPEASETVQASTPITEQMTLEAAAVRAPFVVLRPGYIPNPDQTQFNVFYNPKGPAQKDESLTIFCRGGDSYDSLWIKQRGAPDEELRSELEWDDLSVDGLQMEISDPHPEHGRRVLCCQRENTSVTIFSDLPTAEMAKIAMSLTPVRKQDDQV